MSTRASDRMAELFLFLVAAVFALAGYGLPESKTGGFDLTPRDPAGLRVMTWNIGGSSGPFSNANLDLVAATIAVVDPDIVLLQEIAYPQQLGLLVERVGTDGWKRAIVGSGPRRVAALARRGRLQSWPIESGGERRALALRYQPDDGPPVGIVCLHADAFSARNRNRELGSALTVLNALRDVELRILAGDLNLDVDLDKRRELFTSDEHLDVESYNYVAESYLDAGQGTGSTAEPDRRLDYVFVNTTGANVIAAGPLKGRRAGDMDHDPVIADLRYRR